MRAGHRHDDIATAIRISEEFGYTLIVNHGTEAHKIADVLAEKGIPVVFGLMLTSRSKVELRDRAIGKSATMCYMTTISHREMRNNSAEMLRRVEAGETFTVTNHGEPVAELGPIRRSILDELEAKGQLRPPLHGPQELNAIRRVKLDGGVTTADIISDIRGYERGY